MRFFSGRPALIVSVLVILGMAPFADAATTLSLCNRNTDRGIYGAIMRQVPGAGWQSSGWYSAAAGQCTDAALGTYTGTVYVYAQDQYQQTSWGDGNVTFCVNKTAAFTINNADTVACTDPTLMKVKSDQISVKDGSNMWEAKPNLTLVSLCNQNTSISIVAAIASQTNGSWQSQGWYQLNAGACSSVPLGKYTGTLAFYAEYNGGQYQWGSGPFQFCVNKTQAFSLPSADQAATCASPDVKMVKANQMAVTTGTNTANFSAITLKTTLQLCNQTDLPLNSMYAIAGAVAGQWQSTGWFALAAKKCQQFDLGSYTGKAYTYAEYNGGDQYWGSGPVNVCVNKTQAFTIDDSTNAGKCSQDIAQKMVPTDGIDLVIGANVFNFNP